MRWLIFEGHAIDIDEVVAVAEEGDGSFIKVLFRNGEWLFVHDKYSFTFWRKVKEAIQSRDENSG